MRLQARCIKIKELSHIRGTCREITKFRGNLVEQIKEFTRSDSLFNWRPTTIVCRSPSRNEKNPQMHPNESKQAFCVILLALALGRVSHHTVVLFPFVVRVVPAYLYRFHFYCGSRKHTRYAAVNVQLILIIKILLSLMAPRQVLCGQRLVSVAEILQSRNKYLIFTR